jgi:hypothetical protein
LVVGEPDLIGLPEYFLDIAGLLLPNSVVLVLFAAMVMAKAALV